MKYEPNTIINLVKRGLENNTSGLAMSSKRNGIWAETSINAFNDRILYFALGLYDLGIRKGDKVALHSPNSTEWMISDLAILSLGAVSVPIYTTQPADQIKYILEDSEAKIYIVSDDKMFEGTKPLVKSIESLNSIISIYGSEHEKLQSFEEVIIAGQKIHNKQPDLLNKQISEVKPDDLASIIYTSGTTGVPKGVMLSHNNIASNIQASIERAPFDPKKDKNLKMLSFLPLSHIFERMLDYMYMTMGYPIYYIESLEEIVADIQKVKPHFFATVPRLLEKVYASTKAKTNEAAGLKRKIGLWGLQLADSYEIGKSNSVLKALKLKIADVLVYKKIRTALGGNLIGMISGGAALSGEMMKFFNGIGLYCAQGYGLTETSPVIAVSIPGDLRPGSVGKPITDVEVKIAEDDEILTKGPNVMKGYYKQPEETAAVFTNDGWFMTGDLGRFDEDGHLYITDRKKDLFKLSTGKYVAPQYIENKLAGSLIIEQAAVIGSSRRFCAALIVPSLDAISRKMNTTLTREDLNTHPEIHQLLQSEIDKVNKTLPDWEQIKDFVIISEPFTIKTGELTPTMKMKRKVIYENYKEEIDNLYQRDLKRVDT
ncbi:MAG: long-chain fatty acid--CoA ligase [Balneolales bacterium]